MNHPFLKQKSAQGTDVVWVSNHGERVPAPPARVQSRKRILVIAGGIAMMAALAYDLAKRSVHQSPELPAIPVVISRPRIVWTEHPALPAFSVNVDAPRLEVLVVHAPVPKPTPASETDLADPSHTSSGNRTALGTAVPFSGTAATPEYAVASIVSPDLVLVSMQIEGQTMVSPYRVGQALPDGRSITAIDPGNHLVITNRGTLTVP